MNSYIEANSLSDILQIASNPPKYPRNPTEKQRNPLTLYIARVPGSKDIILTTLKPQLKNVTAADVESSLYLLHLNTEDDARLLAEEQESALCEAHAESHVAEEKPLPRKPLPDTARLSLDLSHSGESDFQRPVQVTAASLHRKPLPVPARSSLDLGRPDNIGPQGQSGHDDDQSCVDREFQLREVTSHESRARPHKQVKETLQRKPLGPRPLGSETSIERKPLSGIENDPLNSGRRIQDFAPSEIRRESVRSDPSHLGDFKTDGSTKSFSLTIIRRDPVSASQWNVGGITGESYSRGMRAISNTRRPNFEISVHLTTPGYTSFGNFQTASHNENQAQSQNRQSAADKSGTAASNWEFHRKVCMEGNSFFGRASKQHNRSQSDSSDMVVGTCGDSAAVLSGVRFGDSAAITHDSKSKGYVFLSPWGGRCKFTTGGGGRSLRCKHKLPESLSSSNAVVGSSGSATVSELRFNLPRSAVFKPSTATKKLEGKRVESERFSIPKLGHIRSKLSQASRPPLPPRTHHPTSYAAMYPIDDEEAPPLPPRAYADRHVASSSDEQEPPPNSVRSQPGYIPRSPSEDDGDRLDLSIGRENAGGGNRGKRAKLGKLIIHDEGFKMLDLVVAANMGIWWSIFDSQ